MPIRLLHARASPPPMDRLAIRRRPVGLDGIEIRKAAGDVLRLVIVIPRASIGLWRALRHRAEHRRAACWRPPLLSFCLPSVLTGHAALSGAAMRSRLSRLAVFRFASATRIRLRSRSLAAQSDDISRFAFAAAASHASPPFFDPAMFRYSRAALVTWSISNA